VLVPPLLAGLLVLAAGTIDGGAQPAVTRHPTVAVAPDPESPDPAGSRPSGGIGPSAVPPPASTSPTPPARVGYVFPVRGHSSYARTHHDYPATDIMAPCGAPAVAATDGVVLAVARTDTYRPRVNAGATRGGLSVSILGDDGVRYYGSHLATVDPAVASGVRVTAGQSLGKVGRTGDAGACHLHFGISPPCGGTGDWWIQRGVVWPWPYLDSWRAGGAKSAVAEITGWLTANRCPTGPVTDP
jgi:murein DD-endopeptidase MepM/ murein hydrolase activator NlpD